MKSIRGSYTLLILACSVLLSLIIGAVSVSTLVSQAEHDANVIMNNACAYEAAQIDTVLEGVEDAATYLVDYCERALQKDANASQTQGYRFSSIRMDDALEEFDGISSSTEGSLLYFMLLDAGAEEPQGFLRFRNDETLGFTTLPVENLLDGENGDVIINGQNEENLGEGEAYWANPFKLPDNDALVAIYAHPIIVDGIRVGLVGMGVDFQIVIDQVASISSFTTGYGYLTDAAGNVMYHPTIPFGTNLSDDDEDVPEVDEAIAQGTTEKFVTYTYNGANKRMAFHLLQNDMRLVLSVEASEIYEQRDRLVMVLILVTLVAAAAFAGISSIIGRKVLAPLNDLTTSAQRVVDGDLDVDIISSDVREVSTLIDAYQSTVTNLREQLAIIDSMAHRDGLTGSFNKSAYKEDQERLDGMIQQGQGGDLRFAVVMLDVNDLKVVNDNYGHEAGDEYLRTAFACMSNAFEGSSVYRIGGDEFVVLLEDERVDDAQKGLEYLEEAMRLSKDIEEPWLRTSFAYGLATFDPESDDSVSSVFERADEAMYACKQRIKHAMHEGEPR